MYKYENKVLKDLPPYVKKMVESYSSDKIALFKAKNVFSEPKGFDSFKFHIISSPMPPIIVENKESIIAPHHVFPINPDYGHAYKVEQEVPEYMVLFMNKEFLKDTSKLIYGDREISFNIDSYRLDPQFQELINLFMVESINQQQGYEFILQSINLQLAVYILRQINNNNITKDIREKSYHDKHFVNKLIEYFMEHYNENYSLDTISQLANYSPYHLIRIFKEHTGKTPYDFLIDIKVKKAQDLLLSTNFPIIEICLMSGFKNRSHFSTIFKKKTGISPQEYRNIMKLK